MRPIDADALEEKFEKIPARTIENADGRAYVLIRLSTVFEIIKQMPSEQPKQTDCEFCQEDSDGYVHPIEKNSHAVIYGSVMHLKAKGWNGKVQIKYCPMCGRRLE